MSEISLKDLNKLLDEKLERLNFDAEQRERKRRSREAHNRMELTTLKWQREGIIK